MAAGIKIGEAFVEIKADSKAAFKNVDKDASAAGDRAGGLFGGSFGKGIAKLGGALAGVFAVSKITDFMSGAVKGASDLNEEASKSQTIFGSSAGSIADWAKNAATNVGLSESAALSATGTFGNMFTQIGFGGKDAANLSKDVVTLAADLGSFNNLPTADVADMMGAAFRGEFDSIQALLPGINAASVEQKALAMTGKTSAKALTEQEKAAAVLALAHQGGAKAQGDFAKTSGGLANSTKITTAKFENMQASLGTKLLPIMTNVMSFIQTDAMPAFEGIASVVMDSIVPAFQNMGTWVQQNASWLGPLVLIIGGLAAAFGLYSLATGVSTAISAAWTAATTGQTIAQWALNAAMSANPIGLVVVAIAALVAGIIWVATQTTFFQDAWAVMSTAIGTAWNWLWTTILQPVFQFIGEAFTNIGNAAMGLWNGFIQPAIKAIGAVFQWLWNSIISPVFTVIAAAFVLLGLGVRTLWNAYVNPAINAIGNVFKWLWNNAINPAINWIRDAIGNVGRVISQLWSSYVNPAIQAIGRAFQWVWNSVISPVANWIGNGIRTLSSTVVGVFQGMATNMQNAFNGVAGVVKGVINGVITMVNGGISGINGFIDLANKVPGVSLPHLGNIPYLATGGTIKSSGMAMVGEQGPELVTLPRGATVHPNGTGPGISSDSGSSTSVSNFYVTIDAKNVKDFNSVVEIMHNLPQTARSGRGTQNMRVA